MINYMKPRIHLVYCEALVSYDCACNAMMNDIYNWLDAHQMNGQQLNAREEKKTNCKKKCSPGH